LALARFREVARDLPVAPNFRLASTTMAKAKKKAKKATGGAKGAKKSAAKKSAAKKSAKKPAKKPATKAKAKTSAKKAAPKKTKGAAPSTKAQRATPPKKIAAPPTAEPITHDDMNDRADDAVENGGGVVMTTEEVSEAVDTAWDASEGDATDQAQPA
jgi:hypothetical protein